MLIACRTDEPSTKKEKYQKQKKEQADKEHDNYFYTVRTTLKGYRAATYASGSLFVAKIIKWLQNAPNQTWQYIMQQVHADIDNMEKVYDKQSGTYFKEIIESTHTLQKWLYLDSQKAPHDLSHYVNITQQRYAIKEPFLCPALPHERARIVSRDAALMDIHQHFQKAQVVVIQGVSGIGKSVLARLYAKKYVQIEATYAYILWFNVDGADNFLSSLKKASQNMYRKRKDRGNAAQYGSALRKKIEAIARKALLIFDNAQASNLKRYPKILPKR